MLRKTFAAIGLVLAAGVAGCSGSNAVDNGTTAQANLSNVEELPANDTLLANDAAYAGETFGNDTGTLNGADLPTTDPLGNAVGNSAL